MDQWILESELTLEELERHTPSQIDLRLENLEYMTK